MNNRLKVIFFIAIVINIKAVIAQQTKDTTDQDRIKSCFKITSFFYTGPEYEQRIGKSSSIDFFTGIIAGLQNDNIWNFNAPIKICPSSYIEYRNYYNFLNRVSKKKNTRNNSANFFFGRVAIYFPIRNQNYFNLLFIQGWTIQRSVWKNFCINFDVEIDEHFYYDKPPGGGFNYIKVEPISSFSFLYTF